MHLSSFRKKKNRQKRKAPKAWQVDVGLISKEEYAEQKKLKDDEAEQDKDSMSGNMKNKTTFTTTASATSKKSSWSKIKKEVRLAQQLEAEQEKIEARKHEMLLRSLGKSERRGSLHYVDIEITDLIPKSGLRLTRATGRMIFELFDDIVPNVTRMFVDMCRFIADSKLTYELGNNEMGFRCVWNQLDKKLDETAMLDRSRAPRFPGRLPSSRDFNWELVHACPGILSMVLDAKAAGLDPQDKGAHKNGFNFQITSRPADELDEMCPVFGRLASGYALLKYIQDLGILPEVSQSSFL